MELLCCMNLRAALLWLLAHNQIQHVHFEESSSLVSQDNVMCEYRNLSQVLQRSWTTMQCINLHHMKYKEVDVKTMRKFCGMTCC